MPVHCAPYPTIVPLQPASSTLYTPIFPSYVRLHRCGGNCYMDSTVYKCAAVKNKLKIVSIRVTKNPGTNESEHCVIQMMNETSCECQCVKSKSDCDLKTQDWKKQRCGCVCKPRLERACRGFFQNWNAKYCTCSCNLALDCGVGQWRDPDNFCHCSPRKPKRAH